MIGLAEFPVSTLLQSFAARQGISRRSQSQTRMSSEVTATDLPKLQTLLHPTGIKIHPSEAAKTVTCLITDSRRVVPGALFFAISGQKSNGNHYLEEAIDRGAVAIVSEEAAGLRCPIPHYKVDDVRLTLALVAKVFYSSPDEALTTTAITGTNGKSTVAILTQHLLGGRDQVGLLGTIRYDLGKRTLPSFRTTPDSVDTFAMLDQMRRGNCKFAVLEASSHGLAQKRIYGMHCEVAAYLNLSRDHLDYHATMEDYFAAKARLFNGENGSMPTHAVINNEDPYAAKLISQIGNGSRITTFGFSKEAAIYATGIRLTAEKSTFDLHCGDATYEIRTGLPGRYNILNMLAAFAIARALGLDEALIVDRLQSLPQVPGRMERITNPHGFQVFVDYAHTDDALNQALTMLRDITPGRLIAVFGCGGNRDRGKRPRMAAVADKVADTLYITSDNPRSEAIESIFKDMRAGLTSPEAANFISDRREAIASAIASARPGDTILIAGKGHETYQEFADSVTPFDDRQVAREYLA
jgi:UDP-N-acetylmuramoyl-L-alanyl-D-glutamate--2,6-diaminopimelate ligase